MAKPATVHSLPPELLLETFQHLLQLEPLGTIDYFEDNDDLDVASSAGSLASSSSEASVDDDYSISDESSCSESTVFSFSLGWTRVTHVCNRWRKIALSTPSLWSSIPANLCLDWVDELLRRSKQVPLDIIIPESHCDMQLTTLLCVEYIQRVRRILCENSNVPLLRLMGETGAPALEELDLSGIASPAIKLNAFKSLRRVNILLSDDDDPTINAFSKSIDLPALTELRLATTSGTHIFPFSSQWSAIFKNLTILDLDCVPFDLDARDEIELPRLRELSIVEGEEYCGSLIRHIRAPFLTKYDVQYFMPEYSVMTDLAAVKAMGFARVLDDAAVTIPALHTLTLTHFRSVWSALIEVHGWRFAGQDENDLEFPVNDTQMTPIDADISHGFDLAQSLKLSNFAVILLSHSAFSTLRMLSVDLNPNLALGDTATWVDLLKPMHQLQHLRISSGWNAHGSPLHILQALQNREREGEYVASSMKRLTLVDWDPDNDRMPHSKDPVAGVILRDIAVTRTREASLKSIHIVSWRRCYDAAWQSHFSEVDGLIIVYEHLFQSLDHVHATAELDSDTNEEDTDADDRASHTSTLILDHSGVPGYEPHLYQ